tara:strand:+ start:1704 stop:1952 length:249 start_codon:yes stop_codon:yes gene_type:complete
MNSYLKSGLVEGSKIMVFFAAISMVWALVIYLASEVGVSPGWAMLTMFTIAIYSLSIATEKLKHESNLAKVKTEENQNGGAE